MLSACRVLKIRLLMNNYTVVSSLHMGSKMTQIQTMISSSIIHVRKNRFHSLLAKCLLCKNVELFIAKSSVYNYYHTLFTTTISLKVTAVTARQPAATRLSAGH